MADQKLSALQQVTLPVLAADKLYLIRSTGGGNYSSNAANVGDLTITPTQAGLSAVSNNAQTFAAVMPNTLPNAGQIPVGNAGNTAYVPQSMSGDGTLSAAGALTIANGAVTLAKQANMATASVVYRKTAGAGAPEVQTLATLKTDLAVTASDVGLGNVTNDAQTKAAIVPNTAPAAGALLVGNAGNTAYVPQSMSGDGTLSAAGALVVTKTNGTNFAASATTDATNASNLSSGTVPSARLPVPTVAAIGGVKAINVVANQFLTGIDTNGNPSQAQPTAGNISGLAASATTDTTNASNISSGTLPSARLPVPTVSLIGGVKSINVVTNQFLTGIDATGTPSQAQPTAGNVSGLAASATTDTTNASNISSGTLAVARGGTGTGSTLTGLVRGNASAFSAAELSGDATTSGSNAVTVKGINGTALSGLATGIVKNTTATGVPSIATANDISAPVFAADAGASDTYVATLSPAPASYVTGTHYRFKANTANTGAASINFNSLGAITIVKVAGGITTALADNDIRAGQWVDLVYDGTNMQMQSLLGNAPSGGAASDTVISPTNIAADTDNWNPTGLSTATIIRLSCSAGPFYLSSITAPGGGAQRLRLLNVSANTIILRDQLAGLGTAANRLALGGYDVPLFPNEGIDLVYDSTSSLWRSVDVKVIPTTKQGIYCAQHYGGAFGAVAGVFNLIASSGAGGGSGQGAGSIAPAAAAMLIENWYGETGTGTTGYGGVIGNNGSSFLLGTAAYWRLSFRLLSATASDVTNTFTVRAGFNDGADASADATDGVYLRYTNSVNSGNWVLVLRNNSAESTTNCTAGPTFSSSVSNDLSIIILPSRVEVWQNGANIGSTTTLTNLPTTRATDLAFGIAKSAGATTRLIYINGVELTAYRATP